MKKRILALLIVACIAVMPVVSAFAEETSSSDILDNSAELKEVEENGIPTEEIVNQLKEQADSLFAEEKYAEAGEVYYETARKANYLANIMSQCIEPYYSSRSDSKTIPNEIMDDLIIFEDNSNELKGLRDLCYVYQGICCNKAGDSETALAVLYRALDLITDTEEEAWILASQEIMGIIQYAADDETALKREIRSYDGKSFEEFKSKYGDPDDSYNYTTLGETSYDYDDIDGFHATLYVDNGNNKIKDISVY